MTTYDLVVIGGGPAGMAAALSAKENGISNILLIERSDRLGGILSQCIHTGFGLSYFGETLTGLEYAARFQERIAASGITVYTHTMVLHLHSDGYMLLSGAAFGLFELHARAVILATGCRERPIGALAITGTRPSGIFTAGAAQKMINIGGYDIGEKFVILGSGDVGMIMARQLKQQGKNVIAVIEKEETCGGLVRNKITCLDDYSIPLRTRCTITQIHGQGRITGVTVLNLLDNSTEFNACDTLITSVGLIPERELSEEASIDGILPEWLFLSGNACYVHDTVDDVTIESERIGKLAADYILYGEKSIAPTNKLPSVHSEPQFGRIICIACPMACVLTPTDDGYLGAICGRTDPTPSKQTGK